MYDFAMAIIFSNVLNKLSKGFVNAILPRVALRYLLFLSKFILFIMPTNANPVYVPGLTFLLLNFILLLFPFFYFSGLIFFAQIKTQMSVRDLSFPQE